MGSGFHDLTDMGAITDHLKTQHNLTDEQIAPDPKGIHNRLHQIQRRETRQGQSEREKIVCPKCHGSRREVSSQGEPIDCSRCNGQGWIYKEQKESMRLKRRAETMQPGANLDHLFTTDNFKDSWVNDKDDTSEFRQIHDDMQNATKEQIDRQNRKPDTSSDNPAQQVDDYDAGFKSHRTRRVNAGLMARVFRQGSRGLLGSHVVLKDRDSGTVLSGRVLADGEREFAVEWTDGDVSVEQKRNFELVEPDQGGIKQPRPHLTPQRNQNPSNSGGAPLTSRRKRAGLVWDDRGSGTDPEAHKPGRDYSGPEGTVEHAGVFEYPMNPGEWGYSLQQNTPHFPENFNQSTGRGFKSQEEAQQAASGAWEQAKSQSPGMLKPQRSGGNF